MYNEVEKELLGGYIYNINETSISFAAEKCNEICRGISNAVNKELRILGITNAEVHVWVSATSPEMELQAIGKLIEPDKEKILNEIVAVVIERAKTYPKDKVVYVKYEIASKGLFTEAEWKERRWEYCPHYIFKFYGMRGSQECLELCKDPSKKRGFCKYENCSLKEKGF